MAEDNVVRFPGLSPGVQKIIEDAVASNPTATDAIVIMFDANNEGLFTTRRYCSKQQLAMAGARLIYLGGCDEQD